MNNSVFNPDKQQQDISSKIVAGLERISEVFKILLWEKAKITGLSPIQIQILLFIAYHKSELCNVSHLAKEFNVTKPTISDAIKVLGKKQMIIKDYSLADSRSYLIQLSVLGNKTISQISDLANPLTSQIRTFKESELNEIFATISSLIHKLHKINILTIQRTCFACKFYQKNNEHNFCKLLNKELLEQDIRLDCPEFEEK